MEKANIDQTATLAQELSASISPSRSLSDPATFFAYVDWRMIGTGPDGLCYLATQRSSGTLVEIKALQPIAKDEGLLNAIEHRVNLINLCSTGLVRRVIDCRLQDNLPMIVLERPIETVKGERTLQDVFDNQVAKPINRLAVARELIAAVRAAHRIGLHHGDLNSHCVILGKDTHLRIDFTGLSVLGRFDHEMNGHDGATRSFRDAVSADSQTDLSDLQSLLRELLGNPSCDLTELPARSRAGLRNMLRNDQATENVPTILQWEKVLGTGRIVPVANDPDATVHTPIEAPIIIQRSSESADSSIEKTGVMDLDNHTPPEFSLSGPLLASMRPALKPGDMVGRYRLEEKLGEGGMGVVYRAIDLSNGSSVAIKIIRSFDVESPQSVRRFQKEARLLAGIQNDYVTRLYEIGEDNGMHYIAMEFVDGVTLKHWLARSGPVPERVALKIVSDIARGLADAHAQGIVHRDIKPENVLLQNAGDDETDLSTKRVKLSDFGIARQIHQSASMEVTKAGVMLGTPRYMSPEQCRGGKEIGPQADVYSLGITLYQMLAGVPPFDADDALTLVSMHCFDPVPQIQKRIPTVSDLTANVISTALAKEPEKRFGDAAQMLASLQRILRGEVADFELHPRMPSHDASRLWKKTFSWDLNSSPAQLWPYVANTERLNRALGLPAVEYRTENDPKLGLRKFGAFKIAGVNVAWEEHPFEWSQGSRMGILREFTSGPFKWFMSIVELKDRPGGGTRLEHQIRIESRNLLGNVMTTVEVDWRGGKNLDRVYRRIDASIQQELRPEQGTDAYEPAHQLAKQSSERLEQRAARLQSRGIDAELISKLMNFIASAPPQLVAQIRPIVLAEQLNVDVDRCLQACLFAVTENLLVLRWDILCPTCRVSASAESLLSSIKEHTHCAACDYDFRSDLGDAIELVFRVHPEIRDADDGVYCVGGPEHSPHVVSQVRLDAGERIELELSLGAGDYLIRGPRLLGQQRIRVRIAPAVSTFETVATQLGTTNHTPVLRAGKQSITLTNDLDHQQVLRIERMVPRDDVVTATQASTLPLFRELFPDQVLGKDRPIEADEMTLVATSIRNADHLYETLGDRDAYDLIAKHLDVINRCVTSQRGTIAKTVGEGVLAAFLNCDFAIDAVLSMQSMLDEESHLNKVQINIAVHRGRTLVATMNQRLDYFGATARLVSELPNYAEGNVLLTETVFGDPVVQERLSRAGCLTSIETISLAGRVGIAVQRVVVPRNPVS